MKPIVYGYGMGFSTSDDVISQPHDVPLIQGTVFLGTASLLPEDICPRCSCADLFFARVLGVCAGGDLYWVEVAALPHYFEATSEIQKRYVRTLFLPEHEFALLVEYDRRLATLPTCEVQEIVQTHTTKVLVEQSSRLSFSMLFVWLHAIVSTTLHTQAAVLRSTSVPDRKEETVQHCSQTPVKPSGTSDDLTDETAARAPRCSHSLEGTPDSLEEDVDLTPCVELFVSRAAVQNAFNTLRITVFKERRVHTALLHAACATLEQQLGQPLDKRTFARIEKQFNQVKAVQDWRRKRRASGHPWQRVVTLEEALSQGKPGWNLVIGVPLEGAA